MDERLCSRSHFRLVSYLDSNSGAQASSLVFFLLHDAPATLKLDG